MIKVVQGVNDLLSQKPDIAKEYCIDKNIKLPNEVRYNDRSNKYWFRCSKCGCEWQATPYYRNYLFCNSCRNKEKHKKINYEKVKKGEGIINNKRYKNLVEEFDYKKNAQEDIYINRLTKNSNKKVYWKCSVCGWRWRTDMAHRVAGNGCPSCAMKVVNKGFNDLQTRYPEIAQEWDVVNNGIDATTVIAGGNKKHWWICRYCGHRWETSILNRIKGTNCPKCRGYGTSFIEQAIYYYLHLIYPNCVNRYIHAESEMEIDIFIPDKNIGIEYDGNRFHKNIEHDLSKSSIINKFGIKLIRIREYKKSKNTLELYDDPNSYIIYYKYSNSFLKMNELIKRIFLILSIEENGFIIDCDKDRFKIRHLQYNGMIDKSLTKTHPEIAEMWDFKRNEPLSPNEVTSTTSMTVNWLCPKCDFSWKRKVINQVKSGVCPKCNDRIVHDDYNFAILYPKLVDEWDYNKNNEDPLQIAPFTHKKYYWICPECKKSYLASPANRINGTGCKDCGRKKADKKRQKPVLQIELNSDKIIKEYNSAREANTKTGISYKLISKCCNGNSKSAGGYHWKFKKIS